VQIWQRLRLSTNDRPTLSSERAPQENKGRNGRHLKLKSGLDSQRGIDTKTDWPSVAAWPWLWLTVMYTTEYRSFKLVCRWFHIFQCESYHKAVVFPCNSWWRYWFWFWWYCTLNLRYVLTPLFPLPYIFQIRFINEIWGPHGIEISVSVCRLVRHVGFHVGTKIP
jgi:hypothetical protein